MSEPRHVASSVPDMEAVGRSADGICSSDSGGGVATPDHGGRSPGRDPAA